MRFELRVELPQLVLLFATILVSAIAWPFTAEPMPVHWDAYGNVDGYGGRFMGLLLLPLICTGLYLLLFFIPRADPRRISREMFAGAYTQIRTLLLGFLFLLHLVIVGAAHGVQLPMNLVMSLLLGGMFVALGPMLRRLEPNRIAGLRTPWTLSSDTVWRKSHQAGGKAMVVAGVLVMLGGLLPGAWPVVVMLTAILGASGWMVLYSYLLWRAEQV